MRKASNSQTSDRLIVFRAVDKWYDLPAGRFFALRDVELKIAKGEFVGIVGRSGSGKSTLLNLIAGIDKPNAGHLLVDGQAIDGLTDSQLTQWRGRNVGVVFQFFQLLPTLTVAENVMLPMDFAGQKSSAARRSRAHELLQLVGIAGESDKFPATLSGGQQQRAAIARALANDPPLILADEPTGNLDSSTADEILTVFHALSVAGKTVVMVTHERDIRNVVDRTVTLTDGRVDEIVERPHVGGIPA